MIRIDRPPALEARVLKLEAPGGAPAAVQIVIPSITRPGEPFDAKVALTDAEGYPSVAFDGKLTVRGDFADPPSFEIAFEKGAAAVGAVRGLTARAEGFHRFSAELGGRTFHSNPTFCTAARRRAIYWGDPHVHTVLSACHADRCRSVQFCYSAGRWLAALDWVSATDHVSNGRCELARWKEQAAASDSHDDPPRFVTLPGYEA